MREKIYSFGDTFGAGPRNVDAVTSVVVRGGSEISTIDTVGGPGATVAGCFMKNVAGAGGHRWELSGNYPDFIVVMVFYLFCQRTKRILVTAITGFKIYILIISLMLFKSENIFCFVFEITMAHLYIYIYS